MPVDLNDAGWQGSAADGTLERAFLQSRLMGNILCFSGRAANALCPDKGLSIGDGGLQYFLGRETFLLCLYCYLSLVVLP